MGRTNADGQGCCGYPSIILFLGGGERKHVFFCGFFFVFYFGKVAVFFCVPPHFGLFLGSKTDVSKIANIEKETPSDLKQSPQNTPCNGILINLLFHS